MLNYPVVKNMAIGDLIYIPGHVMMYLGEHQGEPYVIHDVKGLGYNKGDGSFYSSALEWGVGHSIIAT